MLFQSSFFVHSVSVTQVVFIQPDRITNSNILILIFVFDPLAVLLLIAANISLRQWRRKREIAKTEKQYTLEQRLEKEKKKAERFKEKSRDYKKMVAQVADLKDLSPDEVKLKLDQIYDWNDKS